MFDEQIGNDPIINLVDGWGARTEPDVLKLNELPKERLSEVAFLFGGVGDGKRSLYDGLDIPLIAVVYQDDMPLGPSRGCSTRMRHFLVPKSPYSVPT